VALLQDQLVEVEHPVLLVGVEMHDPFYSSRLVQADFSIAALVELLPLVFLVVTHVIEVADEMSGQMLVAEPAVAIVLVGLAFVAQ